VVQQERLFGFDSLTGRDFGHRKSWVVEQFQRVSRYMAMMILDFAVMDNHLHVMLWTRPDLVRRMSNREVVLRWCYLCWTAGLTEEERRRKGARASRPKEKQIRALLADKEMVAEYRQRLSSISWLMRLVSQALARQANRESGKRGKFFAGRFKSSHIEDQAGLLACSMYINMNPIRAGLASSPGEAQFTSGQLRVLELLQRQGGRAQDLDPRPVDPHPPYTWLAPLYLDPAAAAYTGIEEGNCWYGCTEPAAPAAEQSPLEDAQPDDSEIVSLEPTDRELPDDGAGGAEGGAAPDPGDELVLEEFGPRLTDTGYLPIRLEDYVALMYWTASQLTGAAPPSGTAEMSPLLEQHGIVVENWLETVHHVGRRFPTSVGGPVSLQQRARQRGQRWIKGQRQAARSFASPATSTTTPDAVSVTTS